MDGGSGVGIGRRPRSPLWEHGGSVRRTLPHIPQNSPEQSTLSTLTVVPFCAVIPFLALFINKQSQRRKGAEFFCHRHKKDASGGVI